MTFWFFAASAESWTTSSANFEYDAVNGIAPGCLFANDSSAVSELTIASTPVLIGEPASLWIRLKANNPELPVGDIDLTFSIGGLTAILYSFIPGETLDYDSGWVRVAGVIAANEDVTLLQIAVDGIGGNCLIYVDSVFFLESDGISYGFTRSAGGIPGAVAI